MHLIRRQEIEIFSTNQQLAQQAQNHIQTLFWTKTAARLDRLFSELVGEDRTLRIDRLEIDLGTISAEDFEAVLIEKLREVLRNNFLTASSIKSDAGQSEEKQLPFQVAGKVPSSVEPRNVEDKENLGVQLLPSQSGSYDTLIFFLKTGVMPWWQLRDSEDSNLSLLLQSVLHHEPEKFFAFMIGANLQLQNRMKQQFSLEELLSIVERKDETIFFLLNSLNQRLSEHTDVQLSVRTRLLKKLGVEILVEDELTLHPLLRRVSEELIQQLKWSMPKVKAVFEAIEFPDTIAEAVETILVDILTDDPEQTAYLLNDEKAQETVRETSLATDNTDKEAERLLEDQLKQSLYLQYVGWILCAPFLPTYFSELDLLKKDKRSFLNEEACARAVQLTYYLATGKTAIPEYEILMNKIICGFPIGASLERTLILTDKEIEQTNDLLHSVIEYWSTLGNSSVDALRETFFFRDGKLTQEDAYWKLLVERKSLDILMEKIPWSFTIIQFPWMEKRIMVEW